MARNDDVRSPDGLKVIASAGGPEEPAEALEAKHDEIRPVAASGEMKDFGCGHRGPKLYDLDLYGQVMRHNGKVPDKCGECLTAELRAASCRCALCGLIIMPGDPVALYGPSSEFKRERVTRVRSGVLGCLRWDCCPSGAFFAGHWTGKGLRPAFPDGVTVVEQVFASGQAAGGEIDGLSGSGGLIETPLPPGLARSFRPRWYRRLWDLLRGA